MRDASDMWDFPVMEGVSFTDANRIHPLMQRRVETLIQEAGKDSNIRRMVLYGSSLEFRCSSDSDIDLYIERYDPDKKLAYIPELDCETDIITDLPPDNRLYKEIMATGLLLFERCEDV